MGLKKKNLRRMNYAPSINITPLLDVLTVLLFFLIKSMSVTAVSLSTPDGLRLPASTVKSQAEEALVLAINDEAIWIEQEKIVELVEKNDKPNFKKSDIAPDGRTLIPLKQILDERYAKRLKFYEGIEQAELANIPAPKLLIQADKDHSFKLIKYLLHTVAEAGYTDYQFIVVPPSS